MNLEYLCFNSLLVEGYSLGISDSTILVSLSLAKQAREIPPVLALGSYSEYGIGESRRDMGEVLIVSATGILPNTLPISAQGSVITQTVSSKHQSSFWRIISLILISYMGNMLFHALAHIILTGMIFLFSF